MVSKAACGIECENPLTRTESVGFGFRTIETAVCLEVPPRVGLALWIPLQTSTPPSRRGFRHFIHTNRCANLPSCKDKLDAQLFLNLVCRLLLLLSSY